MRKRFWALSFSILLLAVFLLSGCSAKQTKYKDAFNAAYAWDFDLSMELFSQLPAQYTPSASQPSAIQWIASINKYADSPFIGTWENGTYTINISREVNKYDGLRLKYDKEYTSDGGVRVSDYGYVSVTDDNVTATFYQGHSSNSRNYTLLLNDNAIEVWFNGINGNELEIILAKKQ